MSSTTRRLLVLGIAIVALSATAFTGAAGAGSPACANRVNNTFAKLTECVTLEGVRAHQAALQAIADANNGIRTSGTPGYDASCRVRGRQADGGRLRRHRADVPVPDVHHALADRPGAGGSAAGGAGGEHHHVVLGQRRRDCAREHSCTADDRAAATPPTSPASRPGNIALISRGICTFAIKATNAYNAGASAVVIYNNAAGVLNGTLGNDFTLDIGVTSVTQAVGQQLAATPGLVMRLKTEHLPRHRDDVQRARRDRGRRPEQRRHGRARTSTPSTPARASTTTARAAPRFSRRRCRWRKVKPRNKVRFAWWGAEESGSSARPTT